MLLDLDDQGSLDPGRVGAKAARLAAGRRAGLPVLPGIVVETIDSGAHMRLGAETLATSGSGRARLAMTGATLPWADELVERGSDLGARLVSRSSTLLESDGEWSGAFASYADLTPDELPRAVTGCWASAFSVAALRRQRAASIEPGSIRMAVLIQPALDPAAGGTARIDADDTVVVHGVDGSPASLLQGWTSGHEARLAPVGWSGGELIDLLGAPVLDEIASLIQTARATTGANHCEWALDDRLWLFQLDRFDQARAPTSPRTMDENLVPDLIRLARIVSRVPSRWGDELVLPWALAGLPRSAPVIDSPRQDASRRARELSSRITAETWQMPPDEAMGAAQTCMRGVLGPDPAPALDRIRRLRPPSPTMAAELLALVGVLERDDPTSRRGIGRWEPFVSSVVLSTGAHLLGTPAAPGTGAGVASSQDNPDENGSFLPRQVISALQPLPNLAPLLWNAAGLVTATGSPAAHLFESARALGVPAVCGARIPDGDHIVAVDGHNGVVSILSLYGDDHD